MRRFALAIALSSAVAAVPATAGAAPPSPPPGCNVVVGTPAVFTGSAQGLANKQATFVRLCLPG